MNGIRADFTSNADDARRVEVTLSRPCRPATNRFIRRAHMQCGLIRFRVDRHRSDPHLTTGPRNPNRDLATIGDQNFLEHRHPSITGPKMQNGRSTQDRDRPAVREPCEKIASSLKR